MNPSHADQVEAWFGRHDAGRSPDRDSLRNPEVLLQVIASDISVFSVLAELPLDMRAAQVLDVGCGSGASLVHFLRVGIPPQNVYGIDVLEERIHRAQAAYPGMHLACADAAHTDFPEGRFDLVTESTMFVQLTDDTVARQVAAEMIRVVRPGGYIVLVDWRYGMPGHSEFAPLSRSRLVRLFEVGTRTRLLRTAPGALIPPLGRWLSRHHLVGAYFALSAFAPFLVGQITTVLEKRSVSP